MPTNIKQTYTFLGTNKECAKYDSNGNAVYDRNLPLRNQREVLTGWNLIKNNGDIKVFAKSNNYVLTAYTDLAAEVDLLSGLINTDGVNFGNKGGNQPTILRMTINAFLNMHGNSYNGELFVFNSAFFSNNSLTEPNPTQISFPYRDGGAQHDGFESDSSITTKKIFIKNNFGFVCLPYTDPTALEVANGYTLAQTYGNTNLGYIVGLSPLDISKSPSSFIGRTIIGCRDDDGDGIKETFVILVSTSSNQLDAVDNIKEFGILDSDICILDGGGSTQFVSSSQSYINTNRTLPCAIGIRQ